MYSFSSINVGIMASQSVVPKEYHCIQEAQMTLFTYRCYRHVKSA